MASTVKCNSCNIVIDELLAYIQNKISVIDEISLIKICVSSFDSEQIKRSKSLLFDSLPTDKRKILRKKQGKENRDIEDIVSLFKGEDPEVIPVFVARDLEKLPPVTFDHLDVTKLLKDLLVVQKELNDIKSKYVTVDQLEELKKDFRKSELTTSCRLTSPPPNHYRNMNINTRQGAFLDSGLMGLSQFDMSVASNMNSINILNSSSPEEKRSNLAQSDNNTSPQPTISQNVNSTETTAAICKSAEHVACYVRWPSVHSSMRINMQLSQVTNRSV